MKRFLTILALLFAAYCLSAQQVQIKGKIIKYKTLPADSITLRINTSSVNPIVIKASISKKGEFEFKYTENSTNFCELFFNYQEDRLLLFLTSGDMVSIAFDATKKLSEAAVVGSVQTELFQKNRRMVTGYVNEAENMRKVYQHRIDSLEKAKNDEVADAIRKNPYLLSNIALLSILPEEYIDIYQLVDTSLTSAYPTNEFVAEYHKSLEKVLTLREGSPMADIVLADQNGKMVNLESLRGNVVVVDFWASWCRPCRMEIPNFKKMYEAYHDAGFEIYSISVDNDYAAWRKALTQEQMPWTNVRDDQKIYSNQYNVSSIPFTILIDREGKVVAKGLRGQELSDKIAETLKK